MARRPRSRYPPGYYHVMNRGNARERIFSSAADKNHYKKLAKKIFEDYPTEILAWCIMDNHFHFVLKGEPLDVDDDYKERRAEATVNLLEAHFPVYDFEVNYDKRPAIQTNADTSDIFLLYRLAGILLEKTDMTYTEIADFLDISRYQVSKLANNVLREKGQTDRIRYFN